MTRADEKLCAVCAEALALADKTGNVMRDTRLDGALKDEAHDVLADLRGAVADLDIYTDRNWPRLGRAAAALAQSVIAFVDAGTGPTVSAWAFAVRELKQTVKAELRIYPTGER